MKPPGHAYEYKSEGLGCAKCGRAYLDHHEKPPRAVLYRSGPPNTALGDDCTCSDDTEEAPCTGELYLGRESPRVCRCCNRCRFGCYMCA